MGRSQITVISVCNFTIFDKPYMYVVLSLHWDIHLMHILSKEPTKIEWMVR